jgi:hypothetical protein
MPIAKVKERTKVGILLGLLCLILMCFFGHLRHLDETAYAYTFSFGDGYGMVFRTPQYYELPSILQESVEVHEFTHLMNGTLCGEVRGEIPAYEAQLADLRMKITATKLLLKRTHDPRLRMDLIWLKAFERDTEALLEEYKAQLK